MPTPRPPYPAAFRQQMVELTQAGRKPTELARELGCNVSSIHAWLRQAGGGASTAASDANDAPLPANERQEILELRRWFKQVQMERDTAAKATAWFAVKSEKTITPSRNS